MRNRGFLVILLGVVLALLTSQALAQAPIDGWDKAKFGMSPEELREAYGEEEEYYKDTYYQELDYIEKRYGGVDLNRWESKGYKQHKENLGKYKPFWKETEEYWSREERGFGHPLTLYPRQPFKILGEENTSITFGFVANKLYNIEITLRVEIDVFVYILPESHIEEAARKNQMSKQKLVALKNALARKYGDSFGKEEEELERKYDSVTFGEYMIPIRREILIWSDAKGNTVKLQSDFEQFRLGQKDYSLLSQFTICYFDKELTELGEKKENQWRKEVAQWEKRGEELRTKGLDSF